jgi:hypothetical protein
MGAVHLPAPVKLFCALLLAPGISYGDVATVLEQTFGAITLRSVPQPFTQTTYYEREMGKGLTRVYIAFDPLICITELAAAKHTTNRLEALWTTDRGQRRVNLDPGYLNLAKVVLATTKDYTHRLYIGAGMFAEVTLQYRHRSFQPWDCTYPDYRLATTLAFFNQLRECYKAQLPPACSPFSAP